MKKCLLLGFCIIFSITAAIAQQKIKDGTVTGVALPNKDALLELETNNKGFLQARVALVQKSNPMPLSAHVAGMMVYNTATSNDVVPGVYYNDGSKWVSAKGSNGTLVVENQPGKTGTPGLPGELGGPGAGTNVVINDSGTYIFNPSTNTYTLIVGAKGSIGAVGATGASGKGIVTTVVNPDGTLTFNYTDGSIATTASLKGPKGDVGAIGPQGLVGLIGATGTTGAQGFKGDVGAIGPQGSIGLTGIAGPIGLQGVKGDQGTKGDVGALGQQGVKGDQGTKGDIGALGPQGSIGLTGVAGPTGPQGTKGDLGTTGPQGAQGIKGDKGEKGDDGPFGAQGPVGATGTPGPKGDVGPAGAQGLQGPQGPIGAQGPKGDAAVITSDNGLTKNGNNVQLGGALIKNTAIETTAGNTLSVTGLQTGTVADQLVVADAAGVLKTLSATAFLPLLTADNGLVEASAGNTQLGGTLIKATTLATSPGNTLAITGLEPGVIADQLVMRDGAGILKTLPATAFLPLFTADNGLTASDPGHTQLGGALLKATTISTDATNTLTLTGLQDGDIADKLVVLNAAGVLKNMAATDFLPLFKANNGLKESTPGTTQLGGTLINPTIIATNPGNTLAITGLEAGATTDKQIVVDASGVLKTLAPFFTVTGAQTTGAAANGFIVIIAPSLPKYISTTNASNDTSLPNGALYTLNGAIMIK